MTKKVIFLDRDGVINKYPGDKNYVTSVKGFYFLPGVLKAVKALHRAGFKLIVVSNQAGVNKGFYSRESLAAITFLMREGIEKAGGKIDAVYYCTHRPDENCRCRKPKIGSIRKAEQEFKIKARGAYFIGDSIIDVKTAHTAGCKAILVLSGKEKILNYREWEEQPEFIFKDFAEAAEFITHEFS
ncbi:MAG: HAD family hydrolase [Candidatus Omnitrophica bacterium]|nr:HAD family hydrolase [Candidatus Omnitrophota bacterium]